LGKTFCLVMAEEKAKIVVADLLEEEASRTAQEIVARGGTATAMKVDVTSARETFMMAEETTKAFGRIDIFVNSAAMCVVRNALKVLRKSSDQLVTVFPCNDLAPPF
jgi:NAD(P)-dependent dehydrogenase (short-subunit alcohol dehydrogenase family)